MHISVFRPTSAGQSQNAALQTLIAAAQAAMVPNT